MQPIAKRLGGGGFWGRGRPIASNAQLHRDDYLELANKVLIHIDACERRDLADRRSGHSCPVDPPAPRARVPATTGYAPLSVPHVPPSRPQTHPVQDHPQALKQTPDLWVGPRAAGAPPGPQLQATAAQGKSTPDPWYGLGPPLLPYGLRTHWGCADPPDVPEQGPRRASELCSAGNAARCGWAVSRAPPFPDVPGGACRSSHAAALLIRGSGSQPPVGQDPADCAWRPRVRGGPCEPPGMRQQGGPHGLESGDGPGTRPRPLLSPDVHVVLPPPNPGLGGTNVVSWGRGLRLYTEADVRALEGFGRRSGSDLLGVRDAGPGLDAFPELPEAGLAAPFQGGPWDLGLVGARVADAAVSAGMGGAVAGATGTSLVAGALVAGAVVTGVVAAAVCVPVGLTAQQPDTVTPTVTPTATRTGTRTATWSATRTGTASPDRTVSGTASGTPPPSGTETPSMTPSPTATLTRTPSYTSTRTSTDTRTFDSGRLSFG